LQIQLADAFLKRVAEETLKMDGDYPTLVPTFQSRQPQLEAIASLVMVEAQQGQPDGALYLDSLAHVLAA